jgi:hypothetical protein
MPSRFAKTVVLLFSSLVLFACASEGPRVDDPSVGTSGRKHYGQGHEIKLFSRPTPADASSVPEVGDPEYQEYLEWKRWQEFKAYQEWKRQNPDAEGPAAAPAPATQ